MVAEISRAFHELKEKQDRINILENTVTQLSMTNLPALAKDSTSSKVKRRRRHKSKNSSCMNDMVRSHSRDDIHHHFSLIGDGNNTTSPDNYIA